MKPPPGQDANLAFTLELASHQAALAAFLRSLLPVGSDPRDRYLPASKIGSYSETRGDFDYTRASTQGSSALRGHG